MNKTHDHDDELDQMLQDSLEQVYKAKEERDNQKYDGVVGVPPGWVPEWAESFFRGYRNRLLDVRGYTPNELLTLINQYDEINNNPNGFRWPATYPNRQRVDPHCFQDEIGFLAWLRWCVDKGQKDGLEVLGGGFAVNGMKFNAGGSCKKGKEYEPKKSIRKICEKIGSRDFNDVLDALRDAELCNDLYESIQDPVGVLFTEVDDNLKIIKFMKRGKTPDNQEQRTFGTFRNILTAIKT